MGTTYSFSDYQKSIPFLREIPLEIAQVLAVDEFYFPDAVVEKALRELGKAYGQYVMSYNVKVFRKDIPLTSHLCANYKGAALTEKQITFLNLYETRFQFQKVRFVVYQKPLTKISIEESPFFN